VRRTLERELTRAILAGELGDGQAVVARDGSQPSGRHSEGVPTLPPRNVKIGHDERTGWSSDRPRPDGAPRRPTDIGVRCRVLRPSDRLRYSPGSLVLIASASPAEREEFIERVVKSRGAVLSLEKVRDLLADRVPEDELEDRVADVLDAAVGRRLEGGETTIVSVEGLDEAERERFARMASALRRPRHFILLEASQDAVEDEQRPALNAVRRKLDAGELGAEGFQTALRLGGASVAEVKALVFASPPRDD